MRAIINDSGKDAKSKTIFSKFASTYINSTQLEKQIPSSRKKHFPG